MMRISALAETGALIGDPARANMLVALLDGRALTAGELARAAGVTPQTASSHLARLTEAGLLALEKQGRHRYHRLASRDVAQMIEGMMAVAGALDARRRPVVVGPRDKALRRARTCYDHLAGEVAVAIADRLAERGHVELSPDGAALTETGAAFLAGIGVDLPAQGRHPVFCRPCLDWSERRPHLAGAVGAALYKGCVAQGWLRPVEGSRAVTITRAGEAGLARAFGLSFSG